MEKHPDATLNTSSNIFKSLFAFASKIDYANSDNKNKAVSSISTYLFFRKLIASFLIRLLLTSPIFFPITVFSAIAAIYNITDDINDKGVFYYIVSINSKS